MLPEKVDRYQIISKCGTGGMAIVYKAFDPQRQEEVALKVMMREFLQDQELRVRFKREIEIHSSFRHEAIVPIFGYGQFQGQPYLVIRFMKGGSLGDRIEGGKTLPLTEVVDLLRRITPALDAAHQQSIIHRDMKPSNILFDEQGQAYISDFGIARLEEQPNITMIYGNSMIGSPAYMSPEQGQPGMHLDARCDLYSLGVMVYEMLTGQLPYYDDKPIKLAFDHATKPIPDIMIANPKLPPACKSFIFKAMAKKPDDRFASGAEMTEALALIAQPSKHLPRGGGVVKTDRFEGPSAGKSSTVKDSTPVEPSPKPVPQPANAPKPVKLPKKARFKPSLARYRTSFSEFFRRIFGLTITLPMIQVPALFYLKTPSLLRPVAGWLGLPSTITIPRKTMVTLAKILLILAGMLVLCLGLAVAGYFIYRMSTARPSPIGSLFIVFYQTVS
jgi:serine/threonine protein kinase